MARCTPRFLARSACVISRRAISIQLLRAPSENRGPISVRYDVIDCRCRAMRNRCQYATLSFAYRCFKQRVSW